MGGVVGEPMIFVNHKDMMNHSSTCKKGVETPAWRGQIGSLPTTSAQALGDNKTPTLFYEEPPAWDGGTCTILKSGLCPCKTSSEPRFSRSMARNCSCNKFRS